MENQSIVKRMLNFSWFVTINNGEDFGFVEARQNTRYTIVLYVAKRLFISKQLVKKSSLKPTFSQQNYSHGLRKEVNSRAIKATLQPLRFDRG